MNNDNIPSWATVQFTEPMYLLMGEDCCRKYNECKNITQEKIEGDYWIAEVHSAIEYGNEINGFNDHLVISKKEYDYISEAINVPEAHKEPSYLIHVEGGVAQAVYKVNGVPKSQKPGVFIIDVDNLKEGDPDEGDTLHDYLMKRAYYETMVMPIDGEVDWKDMHAACHAMFTDQDVRDYFKNNNEFKTE